MEDQEIRDQYLENRQQNYVIDNMNAVAGCGGIGVTDGSGEILGVKYDEQLQNEEHDVGDDDELKYVKEVQQSEKQQSVKDFSDCSSNELAENEEVKYKYEIGNGATGMGGIQDGENLMTSSNGHEIHKVEDQLMHDLEENIHPVVSVSESAESCTSREVASTGNLVTQPELEDDEEESSLATNGTSSISENISNPLLNESDANLPTEENNENSIPLGFGAQSPLDLDLDQMQSQLNPDAKEFVPNFGSNPTSPISPLPRDFKNLNTDDSVETKMFFGHPSMAVPRHIITDDDFVAQSPRKGRGDNMDTIALPAEQEFDEEADQRPHELEQDGTERLKVGLGNNTSDATFDQMLTDELVNKENAFQCDGDFKDFQTSKTIDHGPETSVDMCADFSSQQFKELSELDNDVMKQSIYVTNDEPIEDVLNSVQPIPTEIDSTNNSSTEELGTTDLVGDKELLQVEEKEHISNSPSTEDIQFHMLSTLDSSNTCIPLVPIDINDVATMQDSFYLDQNVEELQNQSFLTDTTNPLLGDENMLISSLDAGNAETMETEKDTSLRPEAISCGIFETHGVREATTSSPYKDENSILEEYKELKISSDESGLGQKMSELVLNSDVLLPQTEDIGGTTNENNSELVNTVDDDYCKADEVAESFARTNNENDSEFVNAPDDVRKACEQIPPINENNKTQQLNLETDEVAGPFAETMNENNVEFVNTPDDFGKTDEVAASFAETTNDKHSEFINTPDDFGKTESTTSLAGTTNETNAEVVNNPYDVFEQITKDENMGIQEGNNDQVVVEAPSVETNHTSQLFCTTNREEVEVSDYSGIEALSQADHSEDFKSVEPIMLSEGSVTTPFPLGSHSPTATSAMIEEPEASKTEFVANTENPLDNSQCDQKTTEDMSKNAHVDMYEVMSTVFVKSQTNETENGTAVDTPLHKTENENEDTSIKVQMNSNKGEQTDIVVDDITADISSDIVPNAELVGTTAAAAVALAPITTKIVSPSAAPKTDDAKKAAAKVTANVAKSKVCPISNSTSKRPSATDTAKKTIGSAAKPKLPLKSSTLSAATDKKSSKLTPVCTTTARKIIGTSTTVTKTASKTTTTSSAMRSTSTTTSATKTMMSRPIAATRTNMSATGARKPAIPSSSTAAKPRPASGGIAAPAKPTTLGVPGTNSSVKPKVTSPRSTLTSQLRKTAPGPPITKSPTKSTASNSVGKTVASSLGSRTKPATSLIGSASATATKQVSARPTTKPTNSTTTTSTTTRRITVGGAIGTSTTQTISKTTNSTLRKSSPIKTTAGKTPPKPINSNTVAAKPKSAIKRTPPKSAEHKSNGDTVNETDLNGTTATSPVTSNVEDQQHLSLSPNAIIPSINDPPTQVGEGGPIDNMDLISA